MTTPEQRHRYVSVALRIFAVAAGYYAAAQIGLQFAVIRDQVTPLWPPTGVALTALLVLGLGVWPGITLGALLVNLPIGPSLPDVLLISLGNTLAPVLAYVLLRIVGFQPLLERFRDGLALGAAAFTGTIVSSTVGSLALVGTGAVPTQYFWTTWSVWWTGDAVGILVVTPLLLMLQTVRWQPLVHRYRWLEGLALVALTVTVTVAVTTTTRPLLFLVFPLVILAALRLQLVGATPSALIISVFSVAAAVRAIGPFESLDTVSAMLTLQVFNGSVALTGLLLAAVTAERNKAHQTIQRAVAQLTTALAQGPDRTVLDGWSPQEPQRGQSESPREQRRPPPSNT